MRVALIFNPFRYKVHEENIRIVQKYFGLFPPLSLAWVAAIAEKAGHKVLLVDARTLGLSREDVADILTDFRPDVMGFMMTTYMFQDTLDWIRYLKARFPVPVLVGGYNLRVYPKETLAHPEIDFGVVEQAYYTVPALLEELSRPAPDFNRVPGLVYRSAGEIVVTPHPQPIDFDLFPNPARHLLPNELYAEFTAERRNFTVMVTSLGCPYKCSFCEAGGTGYNPRSPQTVIREIEECYQRQHVRDIDFFDYNFTAERERVLEICRLIREKDFDISWACRSRVDTVDRELLEVMRNSGCSRIYFGIESGSQEALKTMRKGISIDQIQSVLKICRSLGIRTLGFFLIGAPGDTKETVAATIRFARSLPLDYAQFSKTLAKPLTPLWSDLVAATSQDYWKEWVLGLEKDRDLPRPWTTLSNAEIDALAKQAYLSFYVRPGYVFRQIWQVKSLGELKRKVMAFWGMIFRQERVARGDKGFAAFNENPWVMVEAARHRLRSMAREGLK